MIAVIVDLPTTELLNDFRTHGYVLEHLQDKTIATIPDDHLPTVEDTLKEKGLTWTIGPPEAISLI